METGKRWIAAVVIVLLEGHLPFSTEAGQQPGRGRTDVVAGAPDRS